jgi:putative oxidoreductase
MRNRQANPDPVRSPRRESGPDGASTDGPDGPGRRLAILVFTRSAARAGFDRSLSRAAPLAAVALRLSLGLIFLWFGVLKLVGDSPVAALIGATIPWGDPDVVVRLLGIVEVGLGIGLLVGKAQRLLLLALAAHLTGTFLTFVMAPALIMQGGNPFLLTADGEFVLKNLVLISAAVLLACQRLNGVDGPIGPSLRAPVTGTVEGDATSTGNRDAAELGSQVALLTPSRQSVNPASINQHGGTPGPGRRRFRRE